MHNYLKLCDNILRHGEKRNDRTGTGTTALFGTQLKYDMRGWILPAVTVKKTYLKGIFHELIWFLRGEQNIQYLKDKGIKIWDEWADEDGHVGPMYGYQWRNWKVPSSVNWDGWTTESIDQLQQVIDRIKSNPTCRRHIVSCWNVGELEDMNLHPCHILFQFYVTNDGHLDVQVYQRSVDVFLGLPFDLVSYAALTMMICKLTGLEPGIMTYVMGDTHIYNNHVQQVREMMTRKPMVPCALELPTLDNIDEYMYEDFNVIDYKSHPSIKGEVSV